MASPSPPSSLLVTQGLGGASLFVGGFPPENPFLFGFTAVLDLTQNIANSTYRAELLAFTAAQPDLRYLHAPIGDRAKRGPQMHALLRTKCLPFLHAAWASGCRVLVHCRCVGSFFCARARCGHGGAPSGASAPPSMTLRPTNPRSTSHPPPTRTRAQGGEKPQRRRVRRDAHDHAQELKAVSRRRRAAGGRCGGRRGGVH